MSPRTDIRELPLLPLRGMIVFPATIIPLQVGREKSVKAVEQALLGDRLMVLSAQYEMKVDDPKAEDIAPIGTLVEVKQVSERSEGNLHVVVEGIARVRILRYLDEPEYFRIRCEVIREETERTPEIEALMRSVIQQYEQYIKVSRKVPPETMVTVVSVDDPGRLADTIITNMMVRLEDKQLILETFEVKERLERVLDIISREMELVELEKRINVRVRKQMERTQKEYYLREQMKAIQKELGERDDRGTEAEEYRAKISELKLSKELEEKALKEVERLEKMPPMAAEAVVVRTYLDWIVSLPWNVQTEDRLDIEVAERILDEDHYGLKKVKERILEYLAVRQLTKKMRGPILCFVGPPGVGKTSLAKSIARALERKFVRISLGGVRDEAEIRGHRRTYVGALPGRIIQGMKQAGSRNPVFLMDEIDKLSSDFRGDPASALLEVLDPEQNNSFSDHYLEMPFDLSNVMFITTANAVHNIPRPLLDRMEVIYISGYTEEEKVKIAENFLLPKQLKEHGLTAENLEISENTIREIIREYTREAGVRNLERELATICRKVAVELVRGKTKTVKVTVQNLHAYLGVPKYRYGLVEKEDQVGVAMGVAWTETGGDVMPVEVTLMKGKGNLLLTGQLGDVMRESAQAAFSYIRSRADRLKIPEEFPDKMDVHIHVPEGAIPKDGPSAGITMATALVSALTGRPVRREVAMTGEITLRGHILPIGGVKEKVLAAHRAGITTMILPRDNKRDLEDVPANVKRKLEFIFVDNMDQVLEEALIREGEEDGILGQLPPQAEAGTQTTVVQDVQ